MCAQFRMHTLHTNNQVNAAEELRKASKASKASPLFGPMGKASMVGFTLLSRSHYYLRRRSPDPPFPPDHRQAGERGATNTTRGGRRARHPKTTLPHRPPGSLAAVGLCPGGAPAGARPFRGGFFAHALKNGLARKRLYRIWGGGCIFDFGE